MEEGVPIESKMISRRIETAQKPSKGSTSNPANTARIRRRHEQAARGVYPAPPPA